VWGNVMAMNKEARKLIDSIIKRRQAQINLFNDSVLKEMRKDIEVAKKVKTGELTIEHLGARITGTSKFMSEIFRKIEG
jgi:hypothetical protein